jgi:hypothetical protein
LLTVTAWREFVPIFIVIKQFAQCYPAGPTVMARVPEPDRITPMRLIAILVLLGTVLAPARGLADTGLAGQKRLTGEDAAYIDWGVKNCGAKSTEKEHNLVEQANAKDHDGFNHHYLTQYQSKTLVDALASTSKQDAMCTDIKAWYGPQGSRLGDLITWERATSATASDKPASATPSSRKGRRQSNPNP